MFLHIEFHWGDRKRKAAKKTITLEERLKYAQLALVAAQEAGDQSHADSLLREVQSTSDSIEWNRRIARELSVGFDRDAIVTDINHNVVFGF